jgi:hypothetical protein
VVVVDLDHNRIVVPESVQTQIPPLPNPEHAILVSELRKFLHNDLFYLDDYYSSSRAPAAASLLKRAASQRQSTYQAPISPRHHSTAYHAAPSQTITTTSTATAAPQPQLSASSSSLSSSGAALGAVALTTRFDEAIRHAFLLFFVSLFRDYRDHLTYIRVFPEPMAIFNKRNFLLTRPDAAVSLIALPSSVTAAGVDVGVGVGVCANQGWFEPFLETQLFTSFLNRHSWPRANVFDQSIDASLFDLELDQVRDTQRHCLPPSPLPSLLTHTTHTIHTRCWPSSDAPHRPVWSSFPRRRSPSTRAHVRDPPSLLTVVTLWRERFRVLLCNTRNVWRRCGHRAIPSDRSTSAGSPCGDGCHVRRRLYWGQGWRCCQRRRRRR